MGYPFAVAACCPPSSWRRNTSCPFCTSSPSVPSSTRSSSSVFNSERCARATASSLGRRVRPLPLGAFCPFWNSWLSARVLRPQATTCCNSSWLAPAGPRWRSTAAMSRFASAAVSMVLRRRLRRCCCRGASSAAAVPATASAETLSGALLLVAAALGGRPRRAAAEGGGAPASAASAAAGAAVGAVPLVCSSVV